MFSTLIDPSVHLLAVATVQPIPGTPLATLILPSGRVFSCQPNGAPGDRDPGAYGDFERCQIAGTTATFQPVPGKYFTFAVVLVSGL